MLNISIQESLDKTSKIRMTAIQRKVNNSGLFATLREFKDKRTSADGKKIVGSALSQGAPKKKKQFSK